MKVLIPRRFGNDQAAAHLESVGYKVVFGSGTDEERYLNDIADCDAVLACGVLTTKRIIDAADKLKVISSFSVGVEGIDVEYATQRGIWVGNSGDANSNATAEHAMFMIMACAKRASQMGKIAREGTFQLRSGCYSVELENSVIGLIGCGKIGGKVARMAHAGFGAKVLVYDPYLKEENVPEGATHVGTIDEVLGNADFVSLHLPLTESTRGFFGLNEMRKMKHTAFFVNVSRGRLVREAELVEGLKAGLIAGAGIDVYEQEPTDPANPLFRLENVVVTPHSAANTMRTWQKMGLNAAKGIVAALNGQRPKFALNTPDAQQQALRMQR